LPAARLLLHQTRHRPNLADLDFIDSTGLSALVDGLERQRELGGDLTLHSPSPSIMRVLEITGLKSVFVLTTGNSVQRPARWSDRRARSTSVSADGT